MLLSQDWVAKFIDSAWLSDHVLTLVFEILALFILLLLSYRVFLHPLRQFPGPFLGKLTGWRLYFQAASGDLHLQSLKEHQTYGPIIRTAPNVLSLNSISALKEIYASRKINTQKGGGLYSMIQAGAGGSSTHSEIDRTKHATRRRILGHAFTESALRDAEPFIQENVKTWCKQLEGGKKNSEGWTVAKDVKMWNAYLGYDIMGNLAFGKGFHCLEKKDHRYVPELMKTSNEFIYNLSYSPLIPILRPILRSGILLRIGGEVGKKTLQFLGYFQEQLELRISSNDDEIRKDFMSYMLEAQDPETGNGFSRGELEAESGLLISAGSDTSSTALTVILFYLLNNPEILEKAKTEVRSHFSSVDEIHGLSLSTKLPYLYACVDEGMRLSPPVPGHLYREVLEGGINVDGHHIPQGTVVGVSPYVIHHNPEYFPEPFSYRPERWILDEKAGVGEESLAKARAAFCPFSQGSRACIGKKVAYIEILTALAVLLYTLDMRLPAKAEQKGGGDSNSKIWGRQRVDEYQLRDGFLADGDGPMIEFRVRS